MDKYIVTSALPYANGKLHIGHLAGAYLPADIYVRFLKLCNENVIYICGTDEHGAPISIKAEAEKKTPQEIVDVYHNSIKASFDAVHINFDNFSGTSRAVHHDLAQDFFLTLLKNNKINPHMTKQQFCENDKRFLPDRYVEGECPHCLAQKARGDQCDACGKLIDAILLKDPICKLCGNTPIVKETMHWFIDLPSFSKPLRKWLESKENWKDNVKNFILNWIDDGLLERSITRDINWGVPVPLENAAGKVLYVWFDAPIGYISSTIEWSPEKWQEYWFDKKTKLVHFIGKDNIPFHAIIWPALLMGQDKDFVLPWDIPANEYLTLEGEKISTSRDWAIWVEDFVKDFDGDLLRFALAVNAPETKDADFSWKEFQSLVNNCLANVLGNFAHRIFVFAKKSFAGELSLSDDFSKQNDTWWDQNIINEIHCAYSEFKVRKAVKLIIDLAREGNRYFDEQKPWQVAKEDPKKAEKILFNCAELLRVISIVFSPIMPKSMKRLRMMFLDIEQAISPEVFWKDIFNTPKRFIVNEFEPLFKKIEDNEIEYQMKKLYGKTKSE